MGANIVGNCAEVYTKVLPPVALCELGILKVQRVMLLFQHIFCLQLWAFWHFHSSSCLYILFSHRCRVMGDIKASKDCFNFIVTFPPKQRNSSGPTNNPTIYHFPSNDLWKCHHDVMGFWFVELELELNCDPQCFVFHTWNCYKKVWLEWHKVAARAAL